MPTLLRSNATLALSHIPHSAKAFASSPNGIKNSTDNHQADIKPRYFWSGLILNSLASRKYPIKEKTHNKSSKLIKGETIKIFNYGNCKRDFTYIDDIVEGVMRVMAKAPEKKDGEDGLPIPPYTVYNIGNSNPENLLDFVQILQEELIRAKVLPEDYDFEAHKELVPMQPGDVPVTYADTTPLERDFGFKPHTPLREGLRKFAEWYKEYYG